MYRLSPGTVVSTTWKAEGSHCHGLPYHDGEGVSWRAPAGGHRRVASEQPGWTSGVKVPGDLVSGGSPLPGS